MPFAIRRSNNHSLIKEADKGVVIDGYKPDGYKPDRYTPDSENLENNPGNNIINNPGNKKKQPAQRKMHKTIYAFSDR